jgi:thiamine-phosphate pyrophosphorylase
LIRIQITDGTALEDEARWVAGLRGDVDFIQVRERLASAQDLARLVRAAMRVAPVLVNDRADVAIACGAAGVHLRAGSVAPSELRRLAKLTISVACHSAEDVQSASDADYAVLAPIFSPLSKADSRVPLGLDALRRICTRSRVPVIALGGITDSNAMQCVKAGAAGIAGISLWSGARAWPKPRPTEHC